MTTRDLGPLLKRRREINLTLGVSAGNAGPDSPRWKTLATLSLESATIKAEIVATLKAVPFPVYAGGSLLYLTLDREGYVECDLDGHAVGVAVRDRTQVRKHKYGGAFVRPVPARVTGPKAAVGR